jgi:hypothetical protein
MGALRFKDALEGLQVLDINVMEGKTAFSAFRNLSL